MWFAIFPPQIFTETFGRRINSAAGLPDSGRAGCLGPIGVHQRAVLHPATTGLSYTKTRQNVYGSGRNWLAVLENPHKRVREREIWANRSALEGRFAPRCGENQPPGASRKRPVQKMDRPLGRSHLADSDCRPARYECAALPTELKWLWGCKYSNYFEIIPLRRFNL